MAGVGRPDPRVAEVEVHAVDHRVDARDRERPRSHDGGVVADPAHDAIGAVDEQALEGGDEGALTDGAADRTSAGRPQRWRVDDPRALEVVRATARRGRGPPGRMRTAAAAHLAARRGRATTCGPLSSCTREHARWAGPRRPRPRTRPSRPWPSRRGTPYAAGPCRCGGAGRPRAPVPCRCRSPAPCRAGRSSGAVPRAGRSRRARAGRRTRDGPAGARGAGAAGGRRRAVALLLGRAGLVRRVARRSQGGARARVAPEERLRDERGLRLREVAAEARPWPCFMYAPQIGAATTPPGRARAQRAAVVRVADPHRARQVRREADEPRVGEVVGRARLAGRRAADLGGGTRAAPARSARGCASPRRSRRP